VVCVLAMFVTLEEYTVSCCIRLLQPMNPSSKTFLPPFVATVAPHTAAEEEERGVGGVTVKMLEFSNQVIVLAYEPPGRIGQWIHAAKEGGEDYDTTVLLGDRESCVFSQLVARRCLAMIAGGEGGRGLLLGLGLASPLNEARALHLCTVISGCLLTQHPRLSSSA